MRSITRPLATAASATLLVLALSACGDGGDDKASDDKTPSGSSDSPAATSTTGSTGSAAGEPAELCAAISNIVTVVGGVSGQEPNEQEWGQIQDAYGALKDADLPADIPAKEKQGLEIAADAITSLDYADAKKAFGRKDGSSAIPGVTPADNAKAEAFFTWAAQACPSAIGGGASSATKGASSASAE